MAKGGGGWKKVVESGKRWSRVAQGGGGWHKMVEDGKKEGDKFYRCFSTTTAAVIRKSELAKNVDFYSVPVVETRTQNVFRSLTPSNCQFKKKFTVITIGKTHVIHVAFVATAGRTCF